MRNQRIKVHSKNKRANYKSTTFKTSAQPVVHFSY